MTMDDDHEPEPPIVTRTTAEAERTVQQFTELLQLLGWNAIVLSVSRVIEVAPDDYRAPGATATVMDPKALPVASTIAQVLRKQADVLERNNPVVKVEPSGYIHDRSSYASGLREWPK